MKLIFTFAMYLFIPVSTLLTANYSIGFLHMRKAGGTSILDFVDDWMRKNGCFHDIYEKVSLRGVQRGMALQFHSRLKFVWPVSCPYVNFVHEEYGCLDAGRFSHNLPRSGRKELNVTFFTTLRDPIERIVSQAFYGKKDIGFATFNSTLWKMCHLKKYTTREKFYVLVERCHQHSHIQRKKSECVCFSKATTEALRLLKSNEKIWYRWMNSTKYGFGDQYMPNYFIQRLSGVGLTPLQAKRFYSGINCLYHPEDCEFIDSYSTLLNIFQAHKKLPSYYQLPITKRALSLAKNILKTQFDFIIMEQFSTNRTRNAIRSAFFGTYDFFNQSYFHRKNSGMGTLLGLNNYSSLVPPVVLEKLRKENAGDIKLYNYALQIFDQRAIDEGWDNDD